jgi:vacuolar protein sorting-associated protein 54
MNILKAITPKHLAVSAQSLAYIAALVPHIKVQLEALLPQRQHVLLNDLDTVVEDYNANLGKIDERIISIMEDVIKTLCSKINEINWDQPPPSSDPSNYMVELVKNTKKLHSSVKKFFFAEKIKSLFAAIFSKYNQYLEAQYLNLKLYSSHGKNRLLFDVKYYISNLSSLEWVDSPGNMLEVVVNNIRIRDVKEKSLPSVPPANPSSSQQNQSHAAQSITSRTTAMFSGLTNAVKPKVMGSQ